MKNTVKMMNASTAENLIRLTSEFCFARESIKGLLKVTFVKDENMGEQLEQIKSYYWSIVNEKGAKILEIMQEFGEKELTVSGLYCMDNRDITFGYIKTFLNSHCEFNSDEEKQETMELLKYYQYYIENLAKVNF